MPPRLNKSDRNLSPDILPLFEFTTIVNSSLDLNFILNSMLLTVMGKLLVTKGMVMIQRENETYEIVSAKGVDAACLHRILDIKAPIKTITEIKNIKADRSFWKCLEEQNSQLLVIPILSQKKVYGYITLGERLGRKNYTSAEYQLLRSLANITAGAVEKALMVEELNQANRNLARKYQELNTLFDLSKEFNAVFESSRLIKLLTFSLLGQSGVNQYAVYLFEEDGCHIVTSKIEGTIDTEFLTLLRDVKEGILVETMMKKAASRPIAKVLESLGIKVVIPMRTQNETKGLILLGKRLRGGDYTQGDIEFFYSLANLAIISIENARLFREAIEKQRLENELNIAREIQLGLLPQSIPETQGFDIAAMSVPSKQVGGDYYDVIPISEGKVAIAVGDVSGKGTPAALLMANVQAALRAIAPMELSLSIATGRLNDITCQNTGQGRFITFFWGVLNPKNRTLRYVNAGHNPPLLIKANGTIERLEKGGLLLGILKTTAPYEEAEISFNEGDLLFLFTDGVTEAMNSKGEDYSDLRLEALVLKNTRLTAKALLDIVQKDLSLHVNSAPQSDDITMMALKAV